MKRFCILLVLSMTGLAQAADPNLIGHWPMNENTGTTTADTSGNSNTATLMGGLPAWAAGHLGYGLDFNGTGDYLSLGKDIGIAGGTFTIASWVSWDGYSTGVATIIGGSDSGYVQFRINGNYGNETLELLSQASKSVGVSAGTIPTTTWTHVAVTFEGTNYVFYINGSASGTGANATTFTSRNTRIGEQVFLWGEGFSGTMDDVRIYNRVLTGTEITTLYNKTTESDASTGSQVIIMSGIGDWRWLVNTV